MTDTRDRSAPATANLVARGVVQGVVGRGMNFAFAYVVTIVLARRLGAADYGVYGVIMSVLIWFEQAGRFTIPPAAAKLIAEHEGRSTSIQQTALFLGTLLFVLLFVLLWGAAGALAQLFGLTEGGTGLFRLAALDLPLFGLLAVYRGVLQGRHHFLTLGITDALYAGAKLIAVVLLLALWLSVSSALVANAVASLAALVFVMSRLSIKVRKPSSSALRPLIHLALPLGLYMLALQTITNLDLWSLKVLNPGQQTSTVGLYVAARNVAVVPGVILMVVSDVLLPTLSRALADKDMRLSQAYIQGAVRFLAMLIVPMALVMILGADEIMSLIYSDEFRSGGTFVGVLVLYAVALPFIDLFASALSAGGEPYRGGGTLLFVIPMAVVLNFALIGSYGAIGAAYGSALAGVIGAVLLGVLVSRRFGPLVTWRTFLNIAVATSVMALVARQFAMGDSHSVVTSIGCVAIYTLILVLLREVRRTDLEPLAFWKWGVRNHHSSGQVTW